MHSHKHFIIAALTFIFTSAAFAGPITQIATYNDLLEALMNGHRVNVVADASKCKLASLTGAATKSDPDLSSVMGIGFNNNFFLKIRSDNLDNRTSIATIATNTITGAPGDVYRYKRIRIFEDDTAEWYASVSDFKNGTMLASITMLCELVNPAAVKLFDYDAER